MIESIGKFIGEYSVSVALAAIGITLIIRGISEYRDRMQVRNLSTISDINNPIDEGELGI